MTNTLWWLTATLLMTALLWLPYVLDRIVAQGLFGAMGYDESLPAGSEWAQRAKKAHANAIENIAVFAPVVVVHHLVHGGADAAVATAVMVYFVARLLHYLVYVAKVPVLRTLTFFAGWGVTVFVALRVLGIA